jgi:hypothetical protein
MSEVKISPELHSEQASLLQSEYKLVKILKQSGGTDQTISNGAVELQFEIPGNRVINFAKSHLKFTSTFGTPAANKVIFEHRGTLPIRRVRVTTRQGAVLMDLSHAREYINAVGRPETSFSQLRTNDQGSGDLIAPFKPDAIGDAAGEDGKYPFTNAGNPFTFTNSEPQVIKSAPNPHTWSVNLAEAFPNSILALDKSIYFGEVLIMSVTFGARDEFGFEAAAAGTPATGAAVLDDNVTLSNIGLYVAAEANHAVAQMKKNEVMTKGVMLPIDYIHAYKSLQNGPGTGSVQLRFSGGHGQSLYRVYHSLSSGVESLNSLNDNSVGATTATSLYTMINDMRQQEYDLTIASNEDYDYLKSYFKGSAMQSLDMYRNMWTWVEDLGNGIRNPSSKGLRVGLDLTRAEQKWSIYVVQAGNVNHNSFACCQKTLVINNTGVQVV